MTKAEINLYNILNEGSGSGPRIHAANVIKKARSFVRYNPSRKEDESGKLLKHAEDSKKDARDLAFSADTTAKSTKPLNPNNPNALSQRSDRAKDFVRDSASRGKVSLAFKKASEHIKNMKEPEKATKPNETVIRQNVIKKKEFKPSTITVRFAKKKLDTWQTDSKPLLGKAKENKQTLGSVTTKTPFAHKQELPKS